MKIIVLTMVLSMFLLIACDVGFKGDVVADSADGNLVIVNQSNLEIRYMVGEEADLARVSLDLSDHSEWPSLKPGDQAIIGYSDVLFYDEGDHRAWVYWVTEGGEFNSFIVELN